MSKRVFEVRRGCTFCGTCVPACPPKAITFTEKGAVIDPARCVGCGKCAAECAAEAIVPVEIDTSPKKEAAS